MKNLKKIASIALALVLMLALCVPAMAAEGDNATITVTNANRGETYKLVKLFDATYNTTTGTIVYTGEVPAELSAYFEADAQGYISAKVSDLDKTATNAILAWAKGQKAKQTKDADGGPVVFEGLEYGYYVVVSRSGNSNGGAVSVTSTMPDATVVDKSTSGNTPEFPKDGSGKKVTTADGTNTVAVGSTVEYTVKYLPTNWVGNGDEAEQVISYTIADTLPAFLTDTKVTSITLKKADGTEVGTWSEQFDKDNTITLAWADKGDLDCQGEGHAADDDHTNACYKWTSKYPSGCTLEIVYEATVTDKVLETGNENHQNKVSVTYTTTNTTSGDGGDETEDIYTATIVIDKFAADSEEKLAGAIFVLAKKVVDEEANEIENIEEVSHYEYATIDETTKAVSWGTDKDTATHVTTDVNGSASFAGLANGTYYLEETEAPAGYNKLDRLVEVEVGGATTANVSVTSEVENSTGAVLPSTGGIGTTIFYVGGGILVAAAAILLITKKRMSVAD